MDFVKDQELYDIMNISTLQQLPLLQVKKVKGDDGTSELDTGQVWIQKQDTTTCTVFCKYLASEVEGLEEKDFQTFRNIQSKAKERGHQPQQHTFSQSSSATSTFVPQTFQQPQQPAPVERKYI